MKQKSSLWGSISILIGVVIAILALVRGPWLTPLLITVFALWGLWVILTQLVPLWRSENARRQDEKETQRVQEELTAANVPDMRVAQTLLRHVNHRISAQLKSAYPDARWEWIMKNPALLAVQGGIGRIRVYGVPDFDFADVELDQRANLSCALVKAVPDQQANAGEAQPGPAQQPIDPQVWYEVQGRKTLETLIGDLASRGHSRLTLKEDGNICVKTVEGGADQVESTFASFPPKVYWPRLVKVLEQEGLTAMVQDDCVAVSW